MGVGDADTVLAFAGLVDHVETEGLDYVLVTSEVEFAVLARNGRTDDEGTGYGFGGIVGLVLDEVGEQSVLLSVLRLPEAKAMASFG
ncbi:hypothetical protein MASR2M17_05210 [Aminivibrio sp.]